MTAVSVFLAGPDDETALWLGDAPEVPAISQTLWLCNASPRTNDERAGRYRVVDVHWVYRLDLPGAGIQPAVVGAEVHVEPVTHAAAD